MLPAVESCRFQFDVNEDEITVSAVQASTLSNSRQRRVWEGQRVVVTKGPLKGYRGLVKDQNEDGLDVELDARIASSGRTKQRFRVEDVAMECTMECVMQYLFSTLGQTIFTGIPEYVRCQWRRQVA
jgi:hypothetical protein